jgi:galactokinase
MKQLRVLAPGRINLLGEHLDYNQGIVLPAAIDRYIEFDFKEIEGSRVLIEALDLKEQWEFSWDELNTSLPAGWKIYVKGVFLLMGFDSHSTLGLHIRFKSTIPIGAGLSSSAALCCGLAFGLNEFYALGKTRMELALLSQQTEHEFAGVKCGLMDQVASLFGQANHLLAFDCISNEITPFELPLNGAQLFLIDSKVKHNLASSAYNERRASMEHAWALAQVLFPNLKNWRDLKPTELARLNANLDATTQKRLSYVIDEMARVQAVQKLANELALLAPNQNPEALLAQLGTCLNQTHAGLRDLYEVSCPELDFLHEAICAQKGVWGARMMGGGFGGCLLVLVSREFVCDNLQALVSSYNSNYGLHLEWIDIHLSDGVYVV